MASPPGQFKKKLKLANLTSDLPPPVASTSAPPSTCSSVAVVVHSTSNDIENDMLNSFALDSFVLPQDNIELAVDGSRRPRADCILSHLHDLHDLSIVHRLRDDDNLAFGGRR